MIRTRVDNEAQMILVLGTMVTRRRNTVTLSMVFWDGKAWGRWLSTWEIGRVRADFTIHDCSSRSVALWAGGIWIWAYDCHHPSTVKRDRSWASGTVHRVISRLPTLGQASPQPYPLSCACQWCLPSMAGLTMDAVNRWVASCTGTLCHLPLSCPDSCTLGPSTPADIMGKAELWSTVHRLFSVPRLAMALIHKRRQNEAQPLPYLRSCPVLGPSCLLHHGSPGSPSSVLWRSWSLESTELQSRVTGFCFNQTNLNPWTSFSWLRQRYAKWLGLVCYAINGEDVKTGRFISEEGISSSRTGWWGMDGNKYTVYTYETVTELIQIFFQKIHTHIKKGTNLWQDIRKSL